MNSSCVLAKPGKNDGVAAGSHEASYARKYAADVTGHNSWKAVLGVGVLWNAGNRASQGSIVTSTVSVRSLPASHLSPKPCTYPGLEPEISLAHLQSQLLSHRAWM